VAWTQKDVPQRMQSPWTKTRGLGLCCLAGCLSGSLTHALPCGQSGKAGSHAVLRRSCSLASRHCAVQVVEHQRVRVELDVNAARQWSQERVYERVLFAHGLEQYLARR
jgi:hypothetical protein